MPRTPIRPTGDHFFARIECARLECPRCGYIDQFKGHMVKGKVGNPRRRLQERAKELGGWDPLTSRWTCPSCRLRFVLGILAWPIGKGSATPTLPRDQVPEVRQLAEIRAQAEGLWMQTPIDPWRPDGTNICPGCTCAEGAHGTEEEDPLCPFAGAEVPENERLK